MKHIFKKWWFWLIVVLVVLGAAASSSSDSPNKASQGSAETSERSLLENTGKEESKETENPYQVSTATPKPTAEPTPEPTPKPTPEPTPEPIKVKVAGTDRSVNLSPGTLVWKSKTGVKFHRRNDCGTMKPETATQITVEEAKKQGLEACEKCY